MNVRVALRSAGLAFGLSTLVSAVAAVIAISLFSRLLPAWAFGEYAVVLAGGRTLCVLLYGWLRLATYRFLIGVADPKPLTRSTLGLYTWITVGLGLLGASLWLVPAGQVNLALICAVAASQAWYELNLEVLRAQRQSRTYLATVTARALLWIALGVFASHEVASAVPLVGAYCAASVLATSLQVPHWWASRATQPLQGTSLDLFAYGAPLAAVLICGMVLVHAGRFALGMFSSPEEAGAFAIASDVSIQILSLVAAGVSLALDNRANYAYETQGRRSAEQALKQASSLLYVLLLPAAAGAFAMRSTIATVVAGASVRTEVSYYLAMLIPASMLWVAREYGLIRVFAIVKRTRLVILPSLVGAVLTVVVNGLVTPTWRGGAGVAFGLGAAASFAFLFVRSMRLLTVSIPARMLFGAIVSSGGLAAAITIVSQTTSFDLPIKVFVEFASGLLAYVFLMRLIVGKHIISHLLSGEPSNES